MIENLTKEKEQQAAEIQHLSDENGWLKKQLETQPAVFPLGPVWY